MGGIHPQRVHDDGARSDHGGHPLLADGEHHGIYPTLADVCGLPARRELEGVSLRPLLRNPGAEWERPAVCTYFRNNHSVRSERWRYTRYHDGTEELYDHKADPLEWTNLATRHEYHTVKLELSRWMPTVNAADSVHERGAAEGE